MAHSIELLFDGDTEQALRRQWELLADAGLPSQANHRSPTNRPHVTLAGSDHIDPAVDESLRSEASALPIGCRIGAPMLFGTGRVTLVRLIVPAAELLRMQAGIGAASLPFMTSGPFPHTMPGQWTPHVTLARRIAPSEVAAALEAIRPDDVVGTFAGLRRWDGDARVDTLIR